MLGILTLAISTF